MSHFVYNVSVKAKEDPDNKEVLEDKVLTYSFNLNKVVRTHAIDEENVVVLLDDGHEVADVQRHIIDPKKPPTGKNVVETRQRIWVQSEIILTGEDLIQRYYEELIRVN